MLTVLLAGMAMMDQGRPTTIDKWMPTPWTEKAKARVPLREYPRPQLVRYGWLNLNGMWEYAISDSKADAWPGGQGQIRVPFPVQSHLSGVQKQVYADQTLWYRRKFEPIKSWKGRRIRLNFGAVDWFAKVYVNGKLVGEHLGGYDPFSFDITNALKEEGNELTVRVWDPTTDGDQPYGKQSFRPEGIWYTAVTGIWQTVWIEPVNESSIASVVSTTKINGDIAVNTDIRGSKPGMTVSVEARLKGIRVARGMATVGSPVKLKIENPKLWSPDSPTLYDIRVDLKDGKKVVDRVESYFGVREIALQKDEFGIRTYLNGKPIFMFGPLDQGWWPDGLYTAPTDEALRYDLEYLKQAGFNTVRKHVKVEPARFYRHCDEIGLLIWQDMPSNLRYGPGWNTNFRVKNEKPDGQRPSVAKRQFEDEWHSIMAACKPFTCIVVWVPFNEAWGQFDTKRVALETKKLDPSRLVNPASGGNFVDVGDILDIHVYPGPGTPDPLSDRAIVLGEFGGLGLPLEKHTWQEKNNWGYRTFTSSDELLARYSELIKSLSLLKSKGLSAAIYTQTTDVEVEVNGLLTYDRMISKMPVDKLRKVNLTVYGPPVIMKPILATADENASEWQYTTSDPGKGWESLDFHADAWAKGKSGFGTEQTPGAKIGTKWSGDRIWLRRIFDVKDAAGDLWLKIHHDEDATVYLNGRQIAKLPGYTTDYTYVDVPDGLVEKGKNLIAISCSQTSGGQYIDAGIYRATK